MPNTSPAPGVRFAELKTKRLLVLLGSGGVGKTTTSAALALEAALTGLRVLVLTIDPAKRLADALGLESVGNHETEIPLDQLAGRPEGSPGTLHAMMLDTEAAFEDLVARLADSSRVADTIRENRVYRHIIDSLAGAQEYLAGEKIYDATASGRFDLVVLDTPPTANALEFLEASGRIARFLDDRVFRWLLPTEGGSRAHLVQRLLRAPSGVVKLLLAKVFGERFGRDMEEFFLAFQGMHREIRRRAEAVQRLLRSDDTAFLLVTAPTREVVDEAVFFWQQIRERELPFGGFIVNRVHLPAGDDLLEADPEELHRAATRAVGDSPGLRPVLQALRDNLGLMEGLAQRDREAVEALLARSGGEAKMALIPRLAEDIHDLQGLRLVGAHLTA